MGFENDGQIMEFITSHASEYRRLVTQDEEIKGMLRQNPINEDKFLREVKIRLGLAN